MKVSNLTQYAAATALAAAMLAACSSGSSSFTPPAAPNDRMSGPQRKVPAAGTGANPDACYVNYHRQINLGGGYFGWDTCAGVGGKFQYPSANHHPAVTLNEAPFPAATPDPNPSGTVLWSMTYTSGPAVTYAGAPGNLIGELNGPAVVAGHTYTLYAYQANGAALTPNFPVALGTPRPNTHELIFSTPLSNSQVLPAGTTYFELVKN